MLVHPLDATLAALADPTRRGVIDLLRSRPWRASEIADRLGQSRPAMSRHLKVLRTTGLIEPAGDESDARARVYQLRPEPFSALRAWVEEVEQFWGGQLAAFKAHAERLHAARATPAAAARSGAPASAARSSSGARRTSSSSSSSSSSSAGASSGAGRASGAARAVPASRRRTRARGGAA